MDTEDLLEAVNNANLRTKSRAFRRRCRAKEIMTELKGVDNPA